MQFKSFASVASLLAAVATLCNAAALQARSAAVEFCTANNLQGDCFVFFPSNGACTGVGGLNDQISSVHVQAGTTCVVWVDSGCTGRSLFIGSDVAALGDFNFNDVISSFECSSA